MNNRVIALIALLLSVGLFFTYINPLWTGRIAETKEAIESDNQALQAAQAYLARQKELEDKSKNLSPEGVTKLTSMLPDGVDNVGLILSLNALAASSGLSISSIDVSTASANAASSAQSGGGSNPVGSVDLTLAASGDYSAFQTFLRGVERSQRLLDVKDLRVTGSNTGTYTYQMTLRIYWLR
jgi:Tfp pilus assembly protein PilO